VFNNGDLYRIVFIIIGNPYSIVLIIIGDPYSIVFNIIGDIYSIVFISRNFNIFPMMKFIKFSYFCHKIFSQILLIENLYGIRHV